MDELGAEFDDLIVDTAGEDAAANAITRFDDADAPATLGKGAGADETGDAGTDDEDVEGVWGGCGHGLLSGDRGVRLR